MNNIDEKLNIITEKLNNLIEDIKADEKTAAEPQCAGRCPSGGVTSGKIRYRKRESCRKEY